MITVVAQMTCTMWHGSRQWQLPPARSLFMTARRVACGAPWRHFRHVQRTPCAAHVFRVAMVSDGGCRTFERQGRAITTVNTARPSGWWSTRWAPMAPSEPPFRRPHRQGDMKSSYCSSLGRPLKKVHPLLRWRRWDRAYGATCGQPLARWRGHGAIAAFGGRGSEGTSEEANEKASRISQHLHRSSTYVDISAERAYDIQQDGFVWNIPNVLSMCRVLMTPFVGQAIYKGMYAHALGMGLVVGLTDYVRSMARTLCDTASRTMTCTSRAMLPSEPCVIST